MLFELVSVVFTILLSWWYIKRRRFYKCLSMYKEPKRPFLSFFKESQQSTLDLMKNMNEWNKIYGSRFLLSDQLFISDYKIVEPLLRSPTILKKSGMYNYLEPWLGTGLLTSEDLEWKKQRKLITPAFHFQILEPFLEIFDSHAKTLVKKFRKHVDDTSFDIYDDVALCALDIICETSMGTSLDAQENPHSEYIESVKGMLTIFVRRVFSIFKSVEFLFRLTQDYQIQKKLLNVLHTYTESVIIKRRKELTEESSIVDEELTENKKIPLLDLLLKSNYDGKPLSNKQVREQVDTFMFEGHDTVSSGLSFIFYCIAKYPEVQEKVVRELRNIFMNDKHRPCTYNDLQEMEYLGMVIKESMRLYPPVLMFGRYLKEDFHFEGEILPKGLSVIIFIYDLHRQKDIFPDPEEFDPERFSTDKVQERSPYAYVPFSAGVRNCIGQRFAILEIKTVVSEVLRNFELSVVPGEEPMLMFETLLKSANGVRIKIKERKF